ncbi:MAG: phage portal protein, partial [Rhodospirillales bacterium]
GVKMASAIGIAIQSASGAADDGMSLVESGYSAADSGNLAWDTFQAGMIPRLKPGESIESFASNKPSPTFQGFLGWILKEVSIGLGLPYEFLVDPAGQGTASRFILEKAQRRFEERQYCIKKFCDRVWSWVIASAIKRGDLPPSENFWSVRWQTPKKITVDAGREAKANLDALKYGNRTLSEDLGERGQDWQNVRDQIEREADDLLSRAKRLSDQHGVSLDTAVSLISQRTPNPIFNDESSSNQ